MSARSGSIRTFHDAAAVGATEPVGAGEALADADGAGAGDELAVGAAVGEAGGDVVVDGVAAGVVLADAGADVGAAPEPDAATVGEVLAADFGEMAGADGRVPDIACPECTPAAWCGEAASATAPAAEAVSNPTTIQAIVNGRASRRRLRRSWCRPGRPASGGETGEILADVTVLDESFISGSPVNVRVTGSGRQRSVGGTALAPAAKPRSRAVGRWPGSLARQRSISPRTSAGTRSRFTWW